MTSKNQNRTFGFGIFFIIAGLIILLYKMGLIPKQLDDILISWQMLLIAIGLFNLLFTQSRISGYILIIIGVFFLLPEIFDLSYSFRRNFWPILLIAIGVIIIFKHGYGRKRMEIRDTHDKEVDFLDEFNLFSGSEKKISGKNFRGGSITSIFGGSDIDMTNAELSDETNVIEIFYMFGGSNIIVPNDWIVLNKVTSIFGGFSDKRYVTTSITKETKKTLIIRGMVMFGGGEIKGR